MAVVAMIRMTVVAVGGVAEWQQRSSCGSSGNDNNAVVAAEAQWQ